MHRKTLLIFKYETVASIIIDESCDDSTNFDYLRREAFFLIVLVKLLPQDVIAPASNDDLNDYLNQAKCFWNGNISEEDRKMVLSSFEEKLEKETSSSAWDEKSLILWIMEIPDPEQFDWMLDQFIDCIVSANKNRISDAQWMELFWIHFPRELKQWVLS